MPNTNEVAYWNGSQWVGDSGLTYDAANDKLSVPHLYVDDDGVDIWTDNVGVYIGGTQRLRVGYNGLFLYTNPPQIVWTESTYSDILKYDTTNHVWQFIYQSTEVEAEITSGGIVKARQQFQAQGNSGASGTIQVVTDVQWSGSIYQKKTRSLTFTGGIITTIGAESGWINF